MGTLDSIVVVGGSLAGLRGAEALRRHGYAGRLVFVGEESQRPYDRPPLSKELLRGDREPEQVALAKAEAFDGLDLDLRLGARAVELDLDARTVVLDDGEQLGFDGCLIATGAAPRNLPETPPLEGIYTLRSLDDALALRAELERGPRVAVVGAGFIGAEVAATCRARGLDVALIETLPVPLAQAIGIELGAVCLASHVDHGVDLRCGVGVATFQGGTRVERVVLGDGSTIDADVVVVGVGVEPCTGWLESSGLALDDGVVCDAACAASAPGVVAAGDVARWENPVYGRSMRLEHWTNAVEQSEAAAKTLLAGPGAAEPFASVPFVWSDQHDMKIQIAGDPSPDDEMCIAHGSLSERRFVTLYGREGRLVGAVAFNRVRQLMAYRRMMREGATWDDAIQKAQE